MKKQYIIDKISMFLYYVYEVVETRKQFRSVQVAFASNWAREAREFVEENGEIYTEPVAEQNVNSTSGQTFVLNVKQ